jgi:uncharacterized protein
MKVFAVAVVLSAESSGNPAPNQLEITPLRALVLLAIQATLFTAAGVGMWLWAGRSLESFISFSVREGAMGVAFGGALIAIAAALFRGFPRLAEQLVRLQSGTYRFLGPKLGWPAILLISLAAGISEEAALRAGLQTLVGNYVGAWGAIAISSAAFAALHLAKPVITALLFLIGVLFGVAYHESGSLLAVMIAHVLYDVWALRYLNREMHRLGLFDEPTDQPAALAKAPDPV